jgi:hypothetical protein
MTISIGICFDRNVHTVINERWVKCNHMTQRQINGYRNCPRCGEIIRDQRWAQSFRDLIALHGNLPLSEDGYDRVPIKVDGFELWLSGGLYDWVITLAHNVDTTDKSARRWKYTAVLPFDPEPIRTYPFETVKYAINDHLAVFGIDPAWGTGVRWLVNWRS